MRRSRKYKEIESIKENANDGFHNLVELGMIAVAVDGKVVEGNIGNVRYRIRKL